MHRLRVRRLVSNVIWDILLTHFSRHSHDVVGMSDLKRCIHYNGHTLYIDMLVLGHTRTYMNKHGCRIVDEHRL